MKIFLSPFLFIFLLSIIQPANALLTPCESGYTYQAALGSHFCIKEVSANCSAGYTFNSSTGKCYKISGNYFDIIDKICPPTYVSQSQTQCRKAIITKFSTAPTIVNKICPNGYTIDPSNNNKCRKAIDCATLDIYNQHPNECQKSEIALCSSTFSPVNNGKVYVLKCKEIKTISEPKNCEIQKIMTNGPESFVNLGQSSKEECEKSLKYVNDRNNFQVFCKMDPLLVMVKGKWDNNYYYPYNCPIPMVTASVTILDKEPEPRSERGKMRNPQNVTTNPSNQSIVYQIYSPDQSNLKDYWECSGSRSCSVKVKKNARATLRIGIKCYNADGVLTTYPSDHLTDNFLFDGNWGIQLWCDYPPASSTGAARKASKAGASSPSGPVIQFRKQ